LAGRRTTVRDAFGTLVLARLVALDVAPGLPVFPIGAAVQPLAAGAFALCRFHVVPRFVAGPVVVLLVSECDNAKDRRCGNSLFAVAHPGAQPGGGQLQARGGKARDNNGRFHLVCSLNGGTDGALEFAAEGRSGERPLRLLPRTETRKRMSVALSALRNECLAAQHPSPAGRSRAARFRDINIASRNWAPDSLIFKARTRRLLRGRRRRAPADQAEPSVDERPGRADEPNDRGRLRQALPLRQPRRAAHAPRRFPRGPKLRPQTENAERPHAQRRHLQDQDCRARSFHR
jgi:hypothetical protein